MTEQQAPEDRVEPPTIADERATLDGWLDYHRKTLRWKCDGLSDEQLKSRAIPPSNLSLIGLVRHMAEVERSWFANHFGLDTTWIYCTMENLDGDFDNVDDADVAADLAVFDREVSLYREKSREFDLNSIASRRNGRQVSLRWIYTHMIEEYARHNGHADLLREVIDGSTGD